MNQEQLEAVLCTEGPLLILAGAGSGKTRVLTHRIAHIIGEKKAWPSQILAITFTNKAAKEMRNRVAELIGDEAHSMWVSTFHAACSRILRVNIEKLEGYKSNFIVFDGDDQQKIVKECLKELNLNEKNFPPRQVLSEISSAKDKLIGPEKYFEQNMADFRKKKQADIYKLYQKKLKASNALDFDDILLKTVELFMYNPDVLRTYQTKFQYIMVDEYQDTNYCQYKLISLLAKEHQNLCVVGDDDQSIYSWRGADIENILNFERDFKGAKIIKLEQNYRSTKTILTAANSVIKNNFGRKSKQLWTDRKDGKGIMFYKGNDDKEEAAYVINDIYRMAVQEDRSFKEFAILYRTNAQSRLFENLCVERGIPYKIVGGFRYYDRKEVKDIIAYMRLIQNPEENLSLHRIVNVPKRSIGGTTVEKLDGFARETNDSIFGAMLEIDSIEGITPRAKKSIRDFTRIISELMGIADTMGLSELIGEILIRSGYLQALKEDETEEARGREENIKELVSAAIDFEETHEGANLQMFLENLALMSDVDNLNEQNESITMMTLHSAKGLEYPVVFLTGMEEGIFPSQRSYMDEGRLEEERRLMYVGITRAMEKLYLTMAAQRMVFGQTTYQTASQFVKEIPRELIFNVNS